MIPRECKRLAEVDFPIAEVSKHAVKEKSIRHGHPSTLHLWWARRPLASCRAMLLALLLPDPCDPLCPTDFKERARALLHTLPNMGILTDDDTGLRGGLLQFIADFANWDLSTSQTYLDTGRGLVKAAHPQEAPLIVDPFAGGGSIPLEALRLGCETFASDLNPVASLILKVMLEDVPKHGAELADGLRRAGDEVRAKAAKELAEFYPRDPDGATPIAYLWARTVLCEEPACGAEIPLLRSLWLSKKPGRRCALRYSVARNSAGRPTLEFEVFVPTTDGDVAPGIIAGARARCPCCGAVLLPDRVRAQLSAQLGGADAIFNSEGERTGGARLVAVVTTRQDSAKRHYRPASPHDYEPVRRAHLRALQSNGPALEGGSALTLPDEAINPTRPSPNARGLSAVTRYGITRFQSLYQRRQAVAIALIAKCIQTTAVDQDHTPSGSLPRLLAIVLSRMADYCSAQSRWDPSQERNVNAFGRQALPMLWDFAELVPIADSVGSWQSMLDGVHRYVVRNSGLRVAGTTQVADATDHPLPDSVAHVWFTDPPYYDSVPYADLADFFFVWLKRILPTEQILQNPFEPGNPLTPKARECVWNRAHTVAGQPKDPAFFETCVGSAFREGNRFTRDDGIGCVVFAHKSTAGWEALLTGLNEGAWTIVSSWPVATEQPQRLVARDSAALATSIHLVCRPRSKDAPVGDWSDVLRELPLRVGAWMERLQKEKVRGADLVFACIGPALEIFSRYRRVETADGREVSLAEYLEKVWEVVGRLALEQILGTTEAKARNGMVGALEEDARLTALFLWTLQSTDGGSGKQAAFPQSEDEEDTVGDEDEDEGAPSTRGKPRGLQLIYDMVIRFTRPLGIDLEKWDGRIVSIDKGTVRLIPVAERAKQLFGEDLVSTAREIERGAIGVEQLSMFPDAPRVTAPPAIRPRQRGRSKKAAVGDAHTLAGPTTLDRVHAAMLLQSSGQANALRALLKQEQERGQDFLRLANALSALYPRDSEEKRLLDAMLVAMPR